MNPDLLFLFSFVQTDAQVAGESASDTNGDLQKFIIAKQWKKVEEASSKQTMAMNANKKAVNRVEELQEREKNWLQRSDVILFKSDLKK